MAMSGDISPLTLIQHSFRHLLDHVCFESGLLTHLYGEDVINGQLKETLESLLNMIAREKLLIFLAQQSRQKYDIYVQCLIRSNQTHVVEYLSKREREMMGDVSLQQPPQLDVSDAQEAETRAMIDRHTADIINTVDTFDVRPYLFETGVLSLSEYEEVLSASGRDVQCTRLLDILHRVNPDTRPFSRLVLALRKRYSELVDILRASDN